MQRIIYGMLSLVLMVILSVSSCGKKVSKENLTPETYFEYAKDLFERKKYLNAITEFTVITLRYSGHPIVDDAQFYLAQSHYMNDEFLIAAAEFQKIINDYPESPYVEEAFYKIGMSYLNLSQRAELDQEYTTRAMRQFQNFIEAYPGSIYRTETDQRIFELRSKLARKQLMGGNVYRKMGIYDSAVIYYNILLEKYYDTPAAEPALFFKADCLYRMKEFQDAMTYFTAYAEKYPSGRYSRPAKVRISEIQAKQDRQEDGVINTGNQP